MKLRDVIKQYVGVRRAQGGKCDAEHVLRFFCRSLGNNIDIRSVRPRAVGAFLVGSGQLTRNWHAKYYVLRHFYKYAVTRRYVTSAPLPKTIPKPPPRLVPYIYSQQQLRRLVEAASLCQRPRRGPRYVIEPQTLRMIILLLYGAGLRVGEALALNLDDVNLAGRLVTVRLSKFYKSRLIPMGTHLTQAMTAYSHWRHTTHPAADGHTPFFVSRDERRITYITMCNAFKRLRQHTGIGRKDGGRYQPRLHDLRHTFAVHRLVAWYREKADVQQLLPRLSVYLGHIGIESTQIYLTMTPELLEEASIRFACYAQTGVSNE